MLEKNKIPWRIYIIYIAIASLVISGVTFSKYIVTLTGTTAARVANFEYEITTIGENLDVDLDVYLPMTVELAVPDSFNDAANCKEITITNLSECAIQLEADIDEISETGILWCVLLDDPDGDYHSSIVDSLEFDDFDDFNSLRDGINKHNSQTLQNLENMVLGYGESRTLYIVFWAEYSKLFNEPFEQDSDAFISFTVMQVD